MVLVLMAGVVFVKWRSSSQAGDPVGGVVDLSRQDGELRIEDIRVSIVLAPRPLLPMHNLHAVLTFTREGRSVSVDNPLLSFNMTMDMGPHDYVLQKGQGETWVASEVVLPACGSGSRLWFGSLAFGVEGTRHQGRFKLELAREGAP